MQFFLQHGTPLSLPWREWRWILVGLAMFLFPGLFTVLPMARGEPEWLFNFRSKTMGGLYTWSDEVIYQDWRVQRSAMVGHYRLLDPKDRRHAFGSLESCLAKLEKLKVEQSIPPLPKHVVMVLHGLGANRHWMNELSTYLTTEGKFKVVNVGYPSTMGDIGTHTQTLLHVIRHLEGVESLSFVAHSMGNIVIRHALSELAAMSASQQPDITYRRFVMIAPPNHGAVVADKVVGNKFFVKAAQMVAGEGVHQLAPSRGWNNLEDRLATPSFEFGIIVGGKGDDEGYLDAIPGDDDMLLSVATSRLEGAADYVQVLGIHQTLPKNEQVQQYALRFLQTGAFLESGKKQPILPQ